LVPGGPAEKANSQIVALVARESGRNEGLPGICGPPALVQWPVLLGICVAIGSQGLPLLLRQRTNKRVFPQCFRNYAGLHFTLAAEHISPEKQPVTGIESCKHAALEAGEAIGQQWNSRFPWQSCQSSQLIAGPPAAAGKIPSQIDLVGPQQVGGERFTFLDKLGREVVRSNSGKQDWTLGID
jgi:hypothetical protein